MLVWPGLRESPKDCIEKNLLPVFREGHRGVALAMGNLGDDF